MSRRFRPQRRLRNEAFSVAVALAVPLALLAVFPLDALRPLKVPPPAQPSARCAFVTLTPELARKAAASSRMAWQPDRSTARQMRIDLFPVTLPAFPPRPIADTACRVRHGDGSGLYEPDILPPTLAAPPPEKILPQPDAGRIGPTFSREELLKLN